MTELTTKITSVLMLLDSINQKTELLVNTINSGTDKSNNSKHKAHIKLLNNLYAYVDSLPKNTKTELRHDQNGIGPNLGDLMECIIKDYCYKTVGLEISKANKIDLRTTDDNDKRNNVELKSHMVINRNPSYENTKGLHCMLYVKGGIIKTVYVDVKKSTDLFLSGSNTRGNKITVSKCISNTEKTLPKVEEIINILNGLN